MAEVVEVNDWDELRSHCLAWHAMSCETPAASFFHTYDWLASYWRHFGKEQRMRVLVVRAAGKPIGIVPLCVQTQRRQLGKLRVLTYPLDGWGVRYSPIGACQAATLALAMRHIATTPRDWDMIDLPWIADESIDRGRTANAMERAGLLCDHQPGEQNSVVELTGDWESYLASRGSKTRQGIRRLLRTMTELGDRVEYVRHRPESLACGDGEPAWALYDECVDVAQHSWQADSTDGNTLSHPQYRAFLRDAHAAAARRGMVDLSLLRIDGQAVAFNYNYQTDGVVFGLRTGFRSDATLKSVGCLLTALTLRDSFARGDVRFEMGEGDQPYKQHLRTGVTNTIRLTHMPRDRWRTHAVRFGRWLRNGHQTLATTR